MSTPAWRPEDPDRYTEADAGASPRGGDPTRIAVSRTIAAEPAVIFARLVDPQGHVDIDATGMLMGATGQRVKAVGDTFVVHMDREALNDHPLGTYDVTVEIVTFIDGSEIAWTIHAFERRVGHVFGYQLEPGDGVTIVTSYYDWSSIPRDKARGVFPVIPLSALRATLGILARTVV